MNSYDDPYLLLLDNSTFSVDVYQDEGKIIELLDAGCDARSMLTSNRHRNDQKRPYSPNTFYCDVSSFQEVFDEQEKQRNRQFNEILNKKMNKVPARDRTVPRNPRARTMEQGTNEKVDQWERNIADFKNTFLRDQVNLLGDSSIENNSDYDEISENSRTYFSNSKNSLPRREINRKSRKDEMNVKNEIREKIPDFAKNSNESRSTSGFSREEMSEGNRIASANRSTRVDRKKRRENSGKNNNVQINEESEEFIQEKRRSVDRAVDKDSLSDNSRMSTDIEINRNKNHVSLSKEERSSLDQRSKTPPNKSIKSREILQKKTNPSLEKRSKISNENIQFDKDNSREREDINSRRSSQETTKTRVRSQTRTISKSADFDKAKHRANMAKRYANKAWMRKRQDTFANTKTGENNASDNSNANNIDQVQRNDDSRTKTISKSANSYVRKRENGQTETTETKEVSIEVSFDDNAETSRRATKLIEEQTSINRSRTIGVPASKSFSQEKENNSRSSETQATTQGSIQRKDLEKLSAIFLSSALKRNFKPSFSKSNDKSERESRKERHKSVPTNRNRIVEAKLDRISSSRISNEFNSKMRPSISNLSKLPSKTEKWVKSKIPVAISRLKKEFEEPRVTGNRDFSESPFRGQSSRTKGTSRENDEKIDESTSIGIISIDRSDRSKKGNHEIRSRLDEWSKKLEETRRRERNVELKVLKMAKDQKEKRKKEFEKRNFRESVKKSRNEDKKDIVDIAATMLEKKSIGKKFNYATNYNDTRDVIDANSLENEYTIRKESYTKPHSLRNSMYTRYFPTAL